MSDSLFRIFGGAILRVFIIIILKKESPDSAGTMRMAAGIILCVACVLAMTPIIDYVSGLGESFEVGEGFSDAVGVLLKALGISILTHVCATVCRDSGEGNIAYYVELGGKIEIMLLSLPLLSELTDTALELLKMS